MLQIVQCRHLPLQTTTACLLLARKRHLLGLKLLLLLAEHLVLDHTFEALEAEELRRTFLEKIEAFLCFIQLVNLTARWKGSLRGDLWLRDVSSELVTIQVVGVGACFPKRRARSLLTFFRRAINDDAKVVSID